MDIHATFPSFFRAPKVSMKQKAPEKPAEVKGINVVEFKPEQLTGVIKTRTFDESVFVALATQYQVEGPNPVEMCDQNMRIAEKLRQMEIVQFWKIIKLFILADSATEGELENLSDEQDPLQKDSKKDQAVASLFRDEDSLQSGQGSIEECKPNFIFYYYLFSFSFFLSQITTTLSSTSQPFRGVTRLPFRSSKTVAITQTSSLQTRRMRKLSFLPEQRKVTSHRLANWLECQNQHTRSPNSRWYPRICLKSTTPSGITRMSSRRCSSTLLRLVTFRCV